MSATITLWNIEMGEDNPDSVRYQQAPQQQAPGSVGLGDAGRPHPLVVGNVVRPAGDESWGMRPAPDGQVRAALESDSKTSVGDAIDFGAQWRGRQLGLLPDEPPEVSIRRLASQEWGFWRAGDEGAPPALRSTSYNDPDFPPRKAALTSIIEEEWPNHPSPAPDAKDFDLYGIATTQLSEAQRQFDQLNETEKGQETGVRLLQTIEAYGAMLDGVNRRMKKEFGAQVIQRVGRAKFQYESGEAGVEGSAGWTVTLYPPDVKYSGGRMKAWATPALGLKLRQLGYETVGEPQQSPALVQQPSQPLPGSYVQVRPNQPGFPTPNQLPPLKPGDQWVVTYDRSGRQVYTPLSLVNENESNTGTEGGRGPFKQAKRLANGFEEVLNDPKLPPAAKQGLAEALGETGVLQIAVGRDGRARVRFAELPQLGKFAGEGALKVVGGTAKGLRNGGFAGAAAGGTMAAGEFVGSKIMDAITTGGQSFEKLPFEVQERLILVVLQSEALPLDALLQSLDARRRELPRVKRRIVDWTIRKILEEYANRTEAYRTPVSDSDTRQLGSGSQTNVAQQLDVVQEITRFAELRDRGLVTEEEFQTRKLQLLALPPGTAS